MLNTANPIGGNVLVKLEVEAKPLGTAFNGTGTQIGSSWSASKDSQILSATLTGLSADTVYHWRARLRYHPAWSVQPASRWITIPVNGWQEADFRTAGGAGALFRFR